MSNRSQTGVGITDRSLILTGSSQLLMGQNSQRGALLIQNVSSANNLGFAIAPLTEPDPYGNVSNGVITAAIGSVGTYTLLPGGSYEPDGGFIPCAAIYVIGTASQVVSAFESN